MCIRDRSIRALYRPWSCARGGAARFGTCLHCRSMHHCLVPLSLAAQLNSPLQPCLGHQESAVDPDLLAEVRAFESVSIALRRAVAKETMRAGRSPGVCQAPDVRVQRAREAGRQPTMGTCTAALGWINGGHHSPACAEESFSESRETRRNLTRRQMPEDGEALPGCRLSLAPRQLISWI